MPKSFSCVQVRWLVTWFNFFVAQFLNANDTKCIQMTLLDQLSLTAPQPFVLLPFVIQNVKKWAIGLSFTYHCVSSGVLPTYTINWINYSGNDQILDSLDGRRIIRYRTPAAVPLYFRCTSLGVCYQSLIKILRKVTICSPLFLPGIYWSYSKSNSSVSLFGTSH